MNCYTTIMLVTTCPPLSSPYVQAPAGRTGLQPRKSVEEFRGTGQQFESFNGDAAPRDRYSAPTVRSSGHKFPAGAEVDEVKATPRLRRIHRVRGTYSARRRARDS